MIDAVAAVGGEVTKELPIINGVGADLTGSQYQALKSYTGIGRIQPNIGVKTASTVPSYAVKGSPELTFGDSTASWELVNLGSKRADDQRNLCFMAWRQRQPEQGTTQQ